MGASAIDDLLVDLESSAVPTGAPMPKKSLLLIGDPNRPNFVVGRPIVVQFLTTNVGLPELDTTVCHNSGAFLAADKVDTALHPNGVLEVKFTPSYPGRPFSFHAFLTSQATMKLKWTISRV